MNTPELRDFLFNHLHGGSPYQGFDSSKYDDDLQANGNPELLLKALEQAKPNVIIEVGSWKGYSTTVMADWLKAHNQPCLIVCIDTWLGSIEHINGTNQDWNLLPYRSNGYPTLYYHFLANIHRRGHHDIVVPFPQTSSTAARWIINAGILADVVYIDASHEEEDVQCDLEWYWRVVRYGGYLVGDDIRWAGVYSAVRKFAIAKGIEQELVIQGDKWLLKKREPDETREALAALADRVRQLEALLGRRP